jgi:hypothetical protein
VSAELTYINFSSNTLYFVLMTYFTHPYHSKCVSSAIDEQFGDAGDRKLRRILKDLLAAKKKIDRTTRYQGLNLKSFSDIEKIHSSHSHIFDLELFQKKFLDLIRRWAYMVLPIPALSKLNYGSAQKVSKGARKPMTGVVDKENVNRGVDIGKKPSSFATFTGDRQQPNKRQKVLETETHSPVVSETLFNEEAEDEILSSSEDDTEKKSDVRQNLFRKVKELMKNVKDPLDDCLAIAQSARAGQHLAQTQGDDDSSSEDDDDEKPVKKMPPLCQKRKKAYQIKFNDSDDSEEEGVALSEVPARYEHAKSFQAFPEIHVKYHPRKSRRPFTAEEDAAIREGVRQLGAGRWAHIKAKYAMILKDRDAVSLKDRWRTINK